MDNEEEVLAWASRQVKLVVDKFSSKENLPLYFNDFDLFTVGVAYNIPEATDFNKGGMLKVIGFCDEFKLINYRFFKGALLEIHHHPDFIETFEMLDGVMVDEISGARKVKGDSFKIMPFIPHQWRCEEDAHMIISCKKI